MTNFATSAAERIGFLDAAARGLRTRRGFWATRTVLAIRRFAGAFTVDLAVRAGLGRRAGGGLAAASAALAFFLACFAAFFSVLNNLRARLSAAFAARTCCFAAAARASAFSRSDLSHCTIAGFIAMILSQHAQ